MTEPRLSLLLHQLDLAYDQRSWHGPNLRGALRGLSLDALAYRPQPGRHNIWEVVVHCAYWKYRVCRLLDPKAPRSFSIQGSDWFPRPKERSERAWREDLMLLEEWHGRLRSTVEGLDPESLDEQPRKSEFTVVGLVSGAHAHDLYHAGQIRLLRRLGEGHDREITRTTDRSAWTAVDDYITRLLAPPDAGLRAAVEASNAAALPPIAVTPPQGKLLELLAQLRGARSVLEIGTLGGYSTIWLARGLEPGGRITTLELDPRHAEVAARNLSRAGFSDVVDVRVGPADAGLARLVAEGAGPFDLIFIDADKASTPLYFEWALKLSGVGTVVIVDNVVRNGALTDARSDAPDVRGVRRLHEVVAADPRVNATTVQTVGSKGYDGFLIAVVLAP